MDIPPQYLKDIESMPQALQSLVEAELSVGNEIVEVGHSFPAPPVGCYVKLARPVSTRPRASSEGIDFFGRNSSIYSGEFADPKRHFFVIEPALHIESCSGGAPRPPESGGQRGPIGSREGRFLSEPCNHAALEPPLARSRLRLDRDALLTQEGVALVLNTSCAKPLDPPHPPHLVSDDENTASLVEALEHAEFYGGLTQALDQAEGFHPPRVVDALFRGLLKREGENAVHFAAMLMFIHGKASTSFDWDQRPFFLQFHTEDRADRRRHFRELCERIDVNPDEMLRRYDR
jgi:hypothetical protein